MASFTDVTAVSTLRSLLWRDITFKREPFFFPVMLKVAVVFVFVVLACEDLGRMFDNSFPA